jgi:replicative DNA helicase
MESHLPPQNIEMEEAILGAMLLSERAREDAARVGLKAKDFAKPIHPKIFEAIRAADEAGAVDEQCVAAILLDRGQLVDIGGTVHLFTLTQRVPAIANAKAYADEVIEQSRRRWLVNVGHDIARMGYQQATEEDVSQLINRAGELVAGLDDSTPADFTDLDTLLSPMYEALSERYNSGEPPGIPTGFDAFDTITGGLHRKELTVLAARPGMGKSAWATNVAQHMTVEQGRHVAFITLEMGEGEVASRVVSSASEVPGSRLRQTRPEAEDFPKVLDAMNRIRRQAPGRFHIDASGSATPFSIRTKCRRLNRRLGRDGARLDLVVVDYMQLVDADGGRRENRNQEVSYISRQMKRLAMELEVPVLALSQLNRGLEMRPDKRPMLGDLRDSGSIEQDANSVVFLYRDGYYNPDTLHPNHCEMNVAKNRNGKTGRAVVEWQPRFTRFTNRRVAA